MKKNVLDWLLAPDEPAIRHLALTELLEKPAHDPDVQAARAAMKEKGWVAWLFKEQLPEGYWYSYVNLYRPKYVATIWRLLVLADLGVTAQELGMKKACELFLTSWARENGGFGSRPGGAYPSHFCITGNLVRTLIRCGYEDDPRVRSALDWVVKAQKEDGTVFPPNGERWIAGKGSVPSPYFPELNGLEALRGALREARSSIWKGSFTERGGDGTSLGFASTIQSTTIMIY